jgi:putative two-component system response regulator
MDNLDRKRCEKIAIDFLMAYPDNGFTLGHCQRVSHYAYKFAQRVINPGEDKEKQELVEDIRLAGLLHDLGHIYVPAWVLRTPFKAIDVISESDKTLVRDHPIKTIEAIKSFPINDRIRDWILHHHCMNGGTGTPAGICSSKQELGIPAQILIICDLMDAMSTSGYNQAMNDRASLIQITNRGHKKQLSLSLTEEFKTAWLEGSLK